MPSLVSCPGGLIVIGLLTLSSVHINSEIWSNEVSDVQYGRLGSNVTLACGGSRRGSPVEWRLNGSTVPSWQTLATPEGSLTLLNAQHSAEGNYSCHNERGALLRTIKLWLGHLPGFLNVSCRVPSPMKIHCSWTQTVKTYLPTQYISSYSVSSGTTLMEPCHQENLGINKCTITNPYIWNNKHLVNITEVNPLGLDSTITRVNFHMLLKPDPPEAVTPLEVVGQPRRLLVQWKYPETWPDNNAFPLTFVLRYQVLGSRYWTMLQIEVDTSLEIRDALVGHPHLIQVRAQDAFINHSQWSEWSPVVQVLPWSEPLVNTEEPTNVGEYIDFHNETSDTSTIKSPDSPSEDNGNLGLLILLGLFAGVIFAMVFTVIVLLWVRQRRRDNVIKQELASMVKMKSLPI